MDPLEQFLGRAPETLSLELLESLHGLLLANEHASNRELLNEATATFNSYCEFTKQVDALTEILTDLVNESCQIQQTLQTDECSLLNNLIGRSV